MPVYLQTQNEDNRRRLLPETFRACLKTRRASSPTLGRCLTMIRSLAGAGRRVVVFSLLLLTRLDFVVFCPSAFLLSLRRRTTTGRFRYRRPAKRSYPPRKTIPTGFTDSKDDEPGEQRLCSTFLLPNSVEWPRCQGALPTPTNKRSKYALFVSAKFTAASF